MAMLSYESLEQRIQTLYDESGEDLLMGAVAIRNILQTPRQGKGMGIAWLRRSNLQSQSKHNSRP